MQKKNQKFNLNDLKVESFVTNLSGKNSQTIIGGSFYIRIPITLHKDDILTVGTCTAAGPNTEGCCN